MHTSQINWIAIAASDPDASGNTPAAYRKRWSRLLPKIKEKYSKLATELANSKPSAEDATASSSATGGDDKTEEAAPPATAEKKKAVRKPRAKKEVDPNAPPKPPRKRAPTKKKSAEEAAAAAAAAGGEGEAKTEYKKVTPTKRKAEEALVKDEEGEGENDAKKAKLDEEAGGEKKGDVVSEAGGEDVGAGEDTEMGGVHEAEVMVKQEENKAEGDKVADKTDEATDGEKTVHISGDITVTDDKTEKKTVPMMSEADMAQYFDFSSAVAADDEDEK